MQNRGVEIWLTSVFLLICAMVLIGGTTRLTGSGLSMVEWHPLMGILPPLNHDAWQTVFAKYQESPQYLQVNDWMGLNDFKSIFIWEYCHRLLGRLLGFVFVVPWILFVLRRKLRGRLAKRTAIAFALGGAQGVVGWVMVMSGLVDVPEVSHFRLATHLMLALFVACWILWILLDLHFGEGPKSARDVSAASGTRQLRSASLGLLALVALQCLYGAFMAGTKAGFMYSTFPSLNGEMIPSGLLGMNPLSHPTSIHFIHRSLGWILLVAVALFWRKTRAVKATSRQRLSAHLLLAAVALQFTLGVCTVVFHVPIPLAVAHQGGGVLLLMLSLACVHAWTSATKSASPQVPKMRQGRESHQD